MKRSRRSQYQYPYVRNYAYGPQRRANSPRSSANIKHEIIPPRRLTDGRQPIADRRPQTADRRRRSSFGNPWRRHTPQTADAPRRSAVGRRRSFSHSASYNPVYEGHRNCAHRMRASPGRCGAARRTRRVVGADQRPQPARQPGFQLAGADQFQRVRPGHVEGQRRHAARVDGVLDLQERQRRRTRIRSTAIRNSAR